MNESELAKRLADHIKQQVSTTTEHLTLQIESQKNRTDETIDTIATMGIDFQQLVTEEVNAVTTNVDEQISVIGSTLTESVEALKNAVNDLSEDLEATNKELYELRTFVTLNDAESVKRVDELIDKTSSELIEQVDTKEKATIKKLYSLHSDQAQSVNDTIDLNQLEHRNLINTELLRLNGYVESKLSTLKGEKGDQGEKGDAGCDGFLSGVSKWETGAIKKRGESVTHKNGLWLCSSEQTAQEPIIGSDWELVVDGITQLTLVDNELSVIRTSGEEAVLGYAGFKYRGEYDSKAKYKKNDLVSIEGTTFISLNDNNTNRPPSNTWKAFAKRGAKGTMGKQGEPGKSDITTEDVIAIVHDLTTEVE